MSWRKIQILESDSGAAGDSGVGKRARARRGAGGALLLVGTLWFQLPPAALASENLLFNSEFPDTLLYSGWTIYYGSVLDWTGQDSNDCPGSGSGQVDSATTDTGTQWAEVGQCLLFDPSAWTTGAHAAFSYFSFDATLSYAQFFYYSDTACGLAGGNELGFSSSTGPSGPGWHRVAISEFSFPPTTQSILVAVGGDASQPTPIEVLFDRAYFGHVPVVFTDDFETTGGLCRWSAAVP